MYLIFDFDGTIVDSYQTIIAKLNSLSDEYQFSKITSVDSEAIRHLSSMDALKKINIDLFKVPKVFKRVRELIHADMCTLQPFRDMPRVLATLHSLGHSLGIVTSNTKNNVYNWLEHQQLLNLFNFIHVDSIFYSKKPILQKTLKKFAIDRAQAFYIGDEVRDIVAAKQCQIFSMAVTWGYNSETLLSQQEPHYIVHQPEDILTIV